MRCMHITASDFVLWDSNVAVLLNPENAYAISRKTEGPLSKKELLDILCKEYKVLKDKKELDQHKPDLEKVFSDIIRIHPEAKKIVTSGIFDKVVDFLLMDPEKDSNRAEKIEYLNRYKKEFNKNKKLFDQHEAAVNFLYKAYEDDPQISDVVFDMISRSPELLIILDVDMPDEDSLSEDITLEVLFGDFPNEIQDQLGGLPKETRQNKLAQLIKKQAKISKLPIVAEGRREAAGDEPGKVLFSIKLPRFDMMKMLDNLDIDTDRLEETSVKGFYTLI